jgi:hypothetical protein
MVFWGAYTAFRAGRGTWNWYSAARRRDKAAHAAAGIDNGKWTPAAVMFCLWPMTMIGAGVALVRHSPWFWAWAGGTALLLLASFAVSGRSGPRRFERQVLDRYAVPQALDGQVPSRAVLRERAELFEELDELLAQVRENAQKTRPFPVAVTEPMPVLEGDRAARDLLVADLYSVPCLEDACRAAVTVPCIMGIGIPVSLVQKDPPRFCHHSRIRDAVRNGSADEADVIAQFDNIVPPGVL